MGRRRITPKKTHVPGHIEFLTKSQIALQLIDQATEDGITVKAWTFDENYGRDGHFLDGLDHRKLAFVGEVPPTFHVWMNKPHVQQKPAQNTVGRQKIYPRLSKRDRVGKKVLNLRTYSPGFRDQTPQRYRVRDSHKGPEVWDVQWHSCYRKAHDGNLISHACTLIVAVNVRTGELKYFLSNRVPGRNGWTVRDLLRIAFGRWKVEACFREAKEELGWDHFECRSWICVHRHLTATILAQLFCARARHRLCPSEVVADSHRLTLEQVRRAADVLIASTDLPPRLRRQRYQSEHERIRYHQTRNASASVSHRKRRHDDYRALGIDPDQIKSVEQNSS
jgi:SRSO17 transposase